MTSQITCLTIAYSIVNSCADQRKHQRSASLTFVRGIHQSPVNSRHKWPVTLKMLPFDDVIMVSFNLVDGSIMISKIQQFHRSRIRSTSQPREDYVYNMCHARRGMALIINNKNFLPQTEMGPRKGTDVDAENLERTFEGLGFTVRRCDDMTCAQMSMEMKKGGLHLTHWGRNLKKNPPFSQWANGGGGLQSPTSQHGGHQNRRTRQGLV